jgi:hypothetical protein
VKVHILPAVELSQFDPHYNPLGLQQIRSQGRVRPSREFQGSKDMSPRIQTALLMKERDFYLEIEMGNMIQPPNLEIERAFTPR